MQTAPVTALMWPTYYCDYREKDAATGQRPRSRYEISGILKLLRSIHSNGPNGWKLGAARASGDRRTTMGSLPGPRKSSIMLDSHIAPLNPIRSDLKIDCGVEGMQYEPHIEPHAAEKRERGLS
ncbi:hypothetical protein EMCG_07182 [[Emmonsia] crescens]|uniref:Uncharacterized protein n=1 Tax=[Emmonsia] crescens TaxID=73230 RepID=A0A0G2I9B3_9EURO|nr:hypothetical protein EMCG_07182 [Emmonsia crescens UAMH 3008]